MTAANPSERSAREHHVPRAEGSHGLDRRRIVRREAPVLDASLRGPVTAEVEREHPDAAAGEPARRRQPLAQAAVRLVGEHDDRPRPGTEAAEAMRHELHAICRTEPQLVAADAVVARSLASRDRRRRGDRSEGEEERQCGPHRLR